MSDIKPQNIISMDNISGDMNENEMGKYRIMKNPIRHVDES